MVINTENKTITLVGETSLDEIMDFALSSVIEDTKKWKIIPEVDKEFDFPKDFPLQWFDGTNYHPLNSFPLSLFQNILK